MLARWMPHNEGTVDRALRVVLGLGLLTWTAFGAGPVAWVGLVGLVPLATGLAGSCPIYTLFGLRTCALTQA